MSTHHKTIKLSAIAMAVFGVIASMPVRAEEADAAAALKLPTNTIELNVTSTSKSSAKFGEYSGQTKSGGRLNGQLDLRGGDGYTNNETGGTLRWALKANDLGLSSRSIRGNISDAGSWSVGLGIDALTHHLSDSYQTPYIGSNGGNLFTLPANFGVVPGAGTGTRSLTTPALAAQLGDFHDLDISTKRTNTSLNAAAIISPSLSLNFDFNRLTQTGAKLQGFGQNGNLVTGTTPKTEGVVVLPMPTDYRTDTLSLALNWKNDKAYLTAAYNGSFFHDNNDQVGFTPAISDNGAATVLTTQYMATAPSNSVNQLSVGGGYTLRPATKVVGSLSYGLNTQDAAFADPGGVMMKSPMPVTSLNGKVANTHVDLKLTDQSDKSLTLAAGVKYDKRDNKTASNIYNFYAIDTAKNIANYPNTPLSNSKLAEELSGDFRIKQGHNVRLALTHEDVARWCNNYAVNAGYPDGTACVVAKSSSEEKAELGYRLKASDAVEWKFGYAYAARVTDSNPYAVTAMIGTKGGVPLNTTTVAGQNASDWYGFYPFFDASRKQQTVKAGLNLQASEALSLGFSTSYTNDQYGSTYGVTNGERISFNADANLAYSETGVVFGYLTAQQRQRELTDFQTNTAAAASTSATSAKVNNPANATWSNDLQDRDVTIGVGAKQNGLLHGNLDLSVDASYSLGKTMYTTSLNYPNATTVATGSLSCSGANASGVLVGSCGSLPAIRSMTAQLKLAGTYKVSKQAKVNVGYLLQKLHASDYYYNGYQLGYTPPAVLPTNQNAGSYSIHAVGVGLIYSY